MPIVQQRYSSRVEALPIEQPTEPVAKAEAPQPPVLYKEPLTTNPLLNAVLGGGYAAATQAGMAAVTDGPYVLATSLFLNVVAQVVKGLKFIDEHRVLLIIMAIVAFCVGYFLLFDHNSARAFMNMANSTVQAIFNYKADKAAGFNAFAPTPPEREFQKWI